MRRTLHRSFVASAFAGLTLATLVDGCGDGPSAPTAGGDIVFLGSTPAPGGTIRFEQLEGHMTREVVFSFEVPNDPRATSLQIELFDAGGRRCGIATPSVRPVPAGATLRVDIPFLNTGGHLCPYPDETPTVDTHTLTVRLRAAGQTLVMRTLPLRYTLAGPSVAVQHTQPEITAVYWTSGLHTGFPEVPPPGYETEFGCSARDRDGGALTFTLELETPGCPTERHCWSQTQSYPSRNIDETVAHALRRLAPATHARGTFTCTVQQAGAAAVRRSLCFRTSGAPACPSPSSY